MHSFYIYCNNGTEIWKFWNCWWIFRFFVWFFKRIFFTNVTNIFQDDDHHVKDQFQYISGSTKMTKQVLKISHGSIKSSRPTFWRKIYRHKREEEIFYSRWLVKIDSSFLSALLPKLIYNEARHTSSTSLKSQQTLMNWSSCWYNSPLL